MLIDVSYKSAADMPLGMSRFAKIVPCPFFGKNGKTIV